MNTSKRGFIGMCAAAVLAAGATDEAWLLQTNLLERATAG